MSTTSQHKNEVRVRAAPSPTGRVHVGTLRTFLYDYLLAKKYNGSNILRVEDTDEKRKVVRGTEAIIEVMKLFGIDYDEGPHVGGDYGPYIQTERKSLYNKYAEELVSKGHAYHCFCAEERLQKLRDSQIEAKKPPGYDRKCRSISPEDAAEMKKAGKPYVIRLKVPLEGTTVFHDEVLGDVKFKNSNVIDPILLKSDGLPTYHLAVVVDDFLMKITHVLRGLEWLPSAPIHKLLYEYFEWDMPKFVHLSLILNPDGKGKLSKRKGALPAVSYLRKGYLPEAMNNYFALIGWAPRPNEANEDDVYTMAELIERFDIDRLHKQPGRFDPKKFDAISGKHIRRLDSKELVEKVLYWAKNYVLTEFITDGIDEMPEWEGDIKNKVKRYLPLWEADLDFFEKALSLVHERLIYFSEIPELLAYLYNKTLVWTDNDWKLQDHSKAEVASALGGMLEVFGQLYITEKVSHEKWESAIRGYADKIGWKHGEVFMALRSAVTGKLQSPPLFESFEVLGWEKTKQHIEDAI
ncbi:glutamate--tRNA ligase, partial [Candidatus Dojkabacteria bacterium]|nr:glutamate--tRNA ligase [Candidatus Dojkabacteria bacterium]